MSSPPKSWRTALRHWDLSYSNLSEHTSGGREACKLIFPFKTVDKLVPNTSERLQHNWKQFVLSKHRTNVLQPKVDMKGNW